MEEVSTQQAKKQLSQLIERVLQGEDIVICDEHQPLVRLVAVASPNTQPRPMVGTVTSAPVTWTPDAFAPLNEHELREWGL